MAIAIANASKMGGAMDEPGLETPPEWKAIEMMGNVAAGYGAGQIGASLAATMASKIIPQLQGLGEAGAIFPKGYYQQEYPTTIPVKAYTEPGVPFYDEIKGLNPGHALYRAKDNWPGVDVQRTGISPQNLDKAQALIDAIVKLRQQANALGSNGF